MKARSGLLSILLASPIFGCSPAPLLHELTLLSPAKYCSQTGGLCLPYQGCEELGIRKITIHVGPENSEETNLICFDNAIGYIMDVYYQPGSSFYMIDAKYIRKGMEFNISSGPFTEDQTVTPWTINLQ